MPRIMTMNGERQSAAAAAAAAPLDLRTTHREHRGGPGARSPDGGLQKWRPGRPADPHPEPASRKRPADNSSLKLPFRKRPIPAQPESETQPPAAAGGGDRVSAAADADSRAQERSGGWDGSADGTRVGAGALAPRWTEERGHGADRWTTRLLHPIHYNHYPLYYMPPVPEPHHPLAHQTDYLLAASALAAHQDEDGDTPLHIAVVQGEFNIVCTLINLLLRARRGLDIYNNLRQTPLHLAVITKQADMLDVLLRAGADPAALDRNGQTALHLCCEYNQQQCLSVAIAQSSLPTCMEIRNYEGLSPLHLAVLRGHKVIARMLLDAGADINAMDIKSGQSPLMHAVESNNADMVHFLIETGCDVNGQSYSGNTALHGACGRGQVDTVRLLLKSGADSSLKNYHNDTPVMVAKNKKTADVLRGKGSKFGRHPDPHCASVSPHGSKVSENGSPSPGQSGGCSPMATQPTPHRSTPQSPMTASVPASPFY